MHAGHCQKRYLLNMALSHQQIQEWIIVGMRVPINREGTNNNIIFFIGSSSIYRGELSFLQPVHFCICWRDSAVLTGYLFRQWPACMRVMKRWNCAGKLLFFYSFHCHHQTNTVMMSSKMNCSVHQSFFPHHHQAIILKQ